MPVLMPPKRRSSNHTGPPPRPPRPPGQIARDRYRGWWSLVLLALLCAALSGWAAAQSPRHLPWIALTAGFIVYAGAIGYRAHRKR